MELCTVSMRVVKSQLSHCLSLFEAMSEAGRGHRLTDLAERLDMPKSSVQRLLDHLIGEGWAEQDPATGHYALTLRLAVLGQRYMQSAGIADATQGILDRVARATGELARLTVVDHAQLVWIGSAQGAPAGLVYQPSMGERIVSFATANGKAWLATLPDEEASAIALKDGLGRNPSPVGPKAITTLDGLLENLAEVRARGFAIADQEAESGVAAVAVRHPRSRDRPRARNYQHRRPRRAVAAGAARRDRAHPPRGGAGAGAGLAPWGRLRGQTTRGRDGCDERRDFPQGRQQDLRRRSARDTGAGAGRSRHRAGRICRHRRDHRAAGNPPCCAS